MHKMNVNTIKKKIICHSFKEFSKVNLWQTARITKYLILT